MDHPTTDKPATSTEVRVAVHQPDFLPWIGFFVKLAKCDVFVVLDHCENNPRAAFLCKRVKFQLPGSVNWLGIPLVHPDDGRVGVPLDEIQLNLRDRRPLEKALKGIEQTYKRAPFFAEVFPLVKKYFESDEASLVARNMMFIDGVLNGIGITPKQVSSRTLDCKEQAGELVAELVAKVGGTVYVSGDGGRGYQDPESYTRRGIRLAYNHFSPEPYPRFQGVWEPGLSVVDVLMNLGFAGTGALVRELARASDAKAREVGEAVEV